MAFLQLNEYEFDDTWSVGEAMLDDHPMLIRIRQNLRPMAGHPELPHRLRVVWEYAPDNASGLPSPEIGEHMEQCENALVAVFEHDNTTVLTHVLTCDGLRQWVFYASDIQLCADRLNEALPHDPPMPIELSVDSDATWTEYLETLGTVGL